MRVTQARLKRLQALEIANKPKELKPYMLVPAMTNAMEWSKVAAPAQRQLKASAKDHNVTTDYASIPGYENVMRLVRHH